MKVFVVAVLVLVALSGASAQVEVDGVDTTAVETAIDTANGLVSGIIGIVGDVQTIVNGLTSTVTVQLIANVGKLNAALSSLQVAVAKVPLLGNVLGAGSKRQYQLSWASFSMQQLQFCPVLSPLTIVC